MDCVPPVALRRPHPRIRQPLSPVSGRWHEWNDLAIATHALLRNAIQPDPGNCGGQGDHAPNEPLSGIVEVGKLGIDLPQQIRNPRLNSLPEEFERSRSPNPVKFACAEDFVKSLSGCLIGSTRSFIEFGFGAHRLEPAARVGKNARFSLCRCSQISIESIAEKANIDGHVSPSSLNRERFGKRIAKVDGLLGRRSQLRDPDLVILKFLDVLRGS